MRKRHALLATLLVTALGFAPAPSSETSHEDEGFVQVNDPEFEGEGDWGDGSDEQAALGKALGQDLVGAYIRLDEGAAGYTFRIAVASLPPIGGMPELTRYGWSFAYNGADFELDGKFTNFSRGACDPTSGQCPPPRNPGMAPFLLRGNCTTNDANVTTCEELGRIAAVFDPAAGTIDIPIPADLLAGEAGVQECDRITPAASFIGDPLWAAPSAFVTSSGFPHDGVYVEYPFVVPPADPTVDCVEPAA